MAVHSAVVLVAPVSSPSWDQEEPGLALSLCPPSWKLSLSTGPAVAGLLVSPSSEWKLPKVKILVAPSRRMFSVPNLRISAPRPHSGQSSRGDWLSHQHLSESEAFCMWDKAVTPPRDAPSKFPKISSDTQIRRIRPRARCAIVLLRCITLDRLLDISVPKFPYL